VGSPTLIDSVRRRIPRAYQLRMKKCGRKCASAVGKGVSESVVFREIYAAFGVGLCYLRRGGTSNWDQRVEGSIPTGWASGKLPVDTKVGTAFHEDGGELVEDVDLLVLASGEYNFSPTAEMDMQAIVLSVGTAVSLIAEMKFTPPGVTSTASPIVKPTLHLPWFAFQP
jgi:hypothetical protein